MIILGLVLSSLASHANIHTVYVWDGYFQFVDQNITIQLGDTVQWLPLGGGAPTMTHTITSTNIPAGATAFNKIWQAPADTFFQYIPQVAGLYEYECTPHAVSQNMIGSINVIGGGANINNSFSDNASLLLYPNPTPNVLQINGLSSTSKFKIYSLSGEVVLLGKTAKTIDLTSLSAGSYIIEIFGDRPRTMKILKQ
jgi:plastocyanin